MSAIHSVREPSLAQPTVSYRDSLARALESIDYQDLLEELAEIEAPLTVALERDDHVTVGRMVLAVRNAYAERLMKHGEGWDIKTRSAQEAAASVLAGERQ